MSDETYPADTPDAPAVENVQADVPTDEARTGVLDGADGPATEVVDAPVVDDQGNTEPVVPTNAPPDPSAASTGEQFYRHADTGELYVTGVDPNGEHYDLPAQMVPVDVHEAALARVAELEAQVAAKDAYIRDLEDDPYRAPADDGQNGVVTDQLVAYEAQQDEAEIQAWERQTGLSYDEPTDLPDADGVDKVEV